MRPTPPLPCSGASAGSLHARRIVPLILIIAIPIALQLPALLGFLNPDPLLFVSGLAVVQPAPLLGMPGWVDPAAAWTTQALGHLAADDWLRGAIPWWNPYTGAGVPLAAEMQSAPLFLPFVLLLHFRLGYLYLKIVSQVLAGLFSWALLRELDLTPLASLTGAILFALSGTFAWYGDAPIHPIAFLPLLLFGLERARRGGIIWIAVAVAYSILAGFPETAYLDGLLALAWAVLRFAQGGAARWAYAGRVALGGGSGLLLAAPQIWPFLHLLARADLALHFSLVSSVLSVESAPMWLFPYAFGMPLSPATGITLLFIQWNLMGGYLSCALLVMVLAGTAGSRGRPLRFLLAGWLLACIARSFRLPVLTGLIDAIPLVHSAVFSRYAAPGWEMAAVILAAMALDDLAREPASRRWIVALAATLGAAAVAIVAGSPLIARLLAHAPHASGFLIASLAWGGASAACIGALGGLRRPRLLTLVAVADAMLLFAVPMLSGTRRATLDRAPVAFLRAHLGLQRFTTLGPLGANYGAYFRLASLNYQVLPAPSAWVTYVQRHLDPFADARPNPSVPSLATELRDHLAAYQTAGVRYLVTGAGSNPLAPLPAGTEPPHRVFNDGLVAIYELPHPAPYFQTGPACAITPLGRRQVRVRCPSLSSARLTRRELDFPGWRARVNGRNAAIARAGEIFQSVALPSGESTVRFTYAPPFITYAWIACLLGAVILVVDLARHRRYLTADHVACRSAPSGNGCHGSAGSSGGTAASSRRV